MDQTVSSRGLGDWLAWLETLSPAEIVLGLERVQQLLGRLHLARPGRVIHVAGTNGKGSSVIMLEALFMAAGERVGAYISPHIHDYNERIRINAVAASDAEIVAAFERVESLRGETPLTYFEFGTLAALVAFETADVDTIILEVGMGGRLDAVNALEPDGGIITNVSLDHCEWLGHDIDSIAAEKAGILRSGKPFVFGAADLPAIILQRADELGADLYRRGRDFDYALPGADTAGWAWSGRRTSLAALGLPALAGSFQLQNAAAVLALVEALGVEGILDRTVLNGAFGRLELAGRCQLVETDRRWLFDVAHNAAGAVVLRDFLAERSIDGRLIAVIGVLADKDLAGIVAPLLDIVDAWIAVRAEASRAMAAAEMATRIASLSDKPCLVSASLADAMQYAHERSAAADTILVTGSFYVVGPALRWLQERTK